MIKFFTVIVTLSFAILAIANLDQDLKELENMIAKNLDTCINNTKVTGVQLDELGRLNIPNEIPPMCFLACMAKNINIMEDNNKFSVSAIKKLMEPVLEKMKEQQMETAGKQIMDIINKCVEEQTDERDECVAAKKAMECAVSNGKKAGILE